MSKAAVLGAPSGCTCLHMTPVAKGPRETLGSSGERVCLDVPDGYLGRTDQRYMYLRKYAVVLVTNAPNKSLLCRRLEPPSGTLFSPFPSRPDVWETSQRRDNQERDRPQTFTEVKCPFVLSVTCNQIRLWR